MFEIEGTEEGDNYVPLKYYKLTEKRAPTGANSDIYRARDDWAERLSKAKGYLAVIIFSIQPFGAKANWKRE